MANTDQRKIEIIANGTSVNASFKDMVAAAKLMENQLKKLPPASQEFADKSKQFQDVRSRMKGVREEMYGTQTAMQKITSALGPLAAGFSIAFAANKVIDFFKGSSDAAKVFEKSLSSLRSITGASGEDLAFYADEAERIGQTTTLSASQAVEAFKLIGSAKPELLGSKEALAAVTQEAVILAEAAGIQLPQSAAALTTTLNQFDLAATESSRVINVLAAGSKMGAGDINFLNDSISRFGPSAAAMKISIEQSAAAMEVLAEKGIQSEKAGTGFRNVLVELANSSDDLNPQIVGLDKALENLGKQNLTVTELTDKFGKENLTVAQILAGSADRFVELKDSITGTSIAYEQAAINTDNLDGDTKALASAYESLQIGVGKFLNSAGRPLIQTLTEIILALKEAPKFIKENWDLFAALGVALVTFNAANIAAAASTIAHTVAERGRAIATRATAIAQGALNAVMSANPIGLLIKGVALLAGGFLILYNRSETVRAGVAGIWESIKSLASSASDIFSALISGDFSALSDAFSNIGKNTAEAFNSGYAAKMEAERKEREAADAEAQKDKLETVTANNDELLALEETAAQKRKEITKKQLEARKKLRDEYNKSLLEAERAMEDLRLELMDEGEEQRMAKVQLTFEREMSDLEAKKQAVLDNVAITEQERNALLDIYEEERKLKEEEKAAEEEEIRLEEREARIEKELEELDDEEAIKAELLEQQVITALTKDAEANQLRLNLQKQFLADRLKLLQEAGLGETLQAQKIKTDLLAIEKEQADLAIAEEERKRAFKEKIATQGLEASKGILASALQLMDEEARGRKELATALKVLQTGEIVAAGIKEVQKIWEGASTLGPIAGPIVGALQTGFAVARTALAVRNIAATKYAHGGATGYGNVVDMTYDGNSWRQPDGKTANWIGSFARGGHVRGASFGLIAEEGDEYVSPNWMLKSPKYANIFGYLEAERVKGRAFAEGGSTARAPIPASSGDNSAQRQSMEAQMMLNDKLDRMIYILERWPSMLKVVNDPMETFDAIKTEQMINADSRITRG